MSTPTTAQCCVCAEQTIDRCGACEQAGFDLFFCSREHQKLIWPLHKRVCGPGRADPFLWPLLTKEEAQEAKQNLQVKWPDEVEVSLDSLMRGILPSLKMQSTLDLIKGLTEGHSCRMPASQKQIALIIVRHSEGKRLAKPASNGGFYFPFKADVVSIFRAVTETANTHFHTATARFSNPRASWSTPLQHKLLIAYTLERQRKKSKTPLLTSLTASVSARPPSSVSSSTRRYSRPTHTASPNSGLTSTRHRSSGSGEPRDEDCVRRGKKADEEPSE